MITIDMWDFKISQSEQIRKDRKDSSPLMVEYSVKNVHDVVIRRLKSWGKSGAFRPSFLLLTYGAIDKLINIHISQPNYLVAGSREGPDYIWQ